VVDDQSVGLTGYSRRGALFYALGELGSRRDLLKIALTVPSGNPVVFAIFRAPIPKSRLKERTVSTVPSRRIGLPSLLPLARATLRPAMVRSDALAAYASLTSWKCSVPGLTKLDGLSCPPAKRCPNGNSRSVRSGLRRLCDPRCLKSLAHAKPHGLQTIKEGVILLIKCSRQSP
jgi:hypothetical protein